MPAANKAISPFLQYLLLKRDVQEKGMVQPLSPDGIRRGSDKKRSSQDSFGMFK